RNRMRFIMSNGEIGIMSKGSRSLDFDFVSGIQTGAPLSQEMLLTTNPSQYKVRVAKRSFLNLLISQKAGSGTLTRQYKLVDGLKLIYPTLDISTPSPDISSCVLEDAPKLKVELLFENNYKAMWTGEDFPVTKQINLTDPPELFRQEIQKLKTEGQNPPPPAKRTASPALKPNSSSTDA